MWRNRNCCACSSGATAGLEALIVRYTPYVSAVAARILPGCPREWEEVAADVFWAAWQERKKLQPGRLKAGCP